MAKKPKPEHVLDHGGLRTKARRNKRKKGRVGLVSEKENMTAKRWEKVIEATAHGASRADAARAANISLRTIDAYLISNVAAAGQLRDAKMLWTRRSWPSDLIEEICEQIALGKTVKQAAIECGVTEEKRLSGLYRVLLQDKAMRRLYDEARELGAEAMADDIIDISDETDRDWQTNRNGVEIPNHEVINRSRLRVDTRKWLMGKHVARRYGDNKHIEHTGDVNINHAAVLSGGRKRLEKLTKERNKGATTIDNDSGRVVIND